MYMRLLRGTPTKLPTRHKNAHRIDLSSEWIWAYLDPKKPGCGCSAFHNICQEWQRMSPEFDFRHRRP